MNNEKGFDERTSCWRMVQRHDEEENINETIEKMRNQNKL